MAGQRMQQPRKVICCDARFLAGMIVGATIMTCIQTFRAIPEKPHLSAEFWKPFVGNDNAAAASDVNQRQQSTTLTVDHDVTNANVDEEKDSRYAKYHDVYKYQPPQERNTDRNGSEAANVASYCGAAPDFEAFFNLGYRERSRLNEDKLIFEWFFKKQFFGESKPQQIGTYVELGAFDGSEEANTRFFDVCLGWKGLLLEGQPINYQKAVKNRPHAHRMSFAPSCSAEFERVNKTISFYNYPFANSGLVGKALTFDGRPTVDVPCGPITPVLNDVFEGQHINFFSLDVEGSEVQVLQTLDFTKVKIDVMIIEVRNAHCGRECKSRDQVRQIMADAGYIRSDRNIPNSDLYIHPQSPYQID